MSEHIRAIVFDAGGVLHESNTAVTESLAEELGLSEEQLHEIWQTDIQELGKGTIGETAFWERLSNRYDIRKVHPEENLLGRPFADSYTPTAGMEKMLGRYRWMGTGIGLLSNTIEPHSVVLREKTKNFHYFSKDAVVLSHEVGMRKPEPGTFQIVLDRLHVRPEEAVMVDDDPANVAAAKELGMAGIVFESVVQVQDELNELRVY